MNTSLFQRMVRHGKWRYGQVLKTARNRRARKYWDQRVKGISAMVRVKNEEQFLAPSILSIAGLVDEIVIIDNQSTDGTPEIIAQLLRAIGPKLKAHSYDHTITRVGSEFQQLYQADPSSPRLLTNYYNWCLARCSMPFVMKWDGDMIALEPFVAALEQFKKGPFLQFDFGGHNLSSDCRNLLTWVAGIEPRVFPKAHANFGSGAYGGEQLEGWVSGANTLRLEEALYAHMKYCKVDPGSNQTPEFRKALEAGIQIGAPTPPEVGRDVQHWIQKAAVPTNISGKIL